VLGAIVLARKQDPTADGAADEPRIPARRILARPSDVRPGSGG